MIHSSLVSLFAFFAIVLSARLTNAAERVQLREINYGVENLKYKSDLLEEPSGCLADPSDSQSTKQRACAFRVGQGRKLILKFDQRTITVADNTIVIREASDTYRIIEGFVRVEGEGRTNFYVSGSKDPKRGSRIQGSGEFFVERYGNSVSVVNTGSKKVSVHTDGREQGVIGTGMEVRFDKPDRRSGKYEIAAPLPLNLELQVVREAKLFVGDKKDFTDRIDAVLALQRRAAEITAEIHRHSVLRKVASLEAEAEMRRQAAAKREAEDREIRAMFRRKVLSVE